LINELDTRLFTFPRIKRGTPRVEDMVQSGTKITDRMLFDYVSTTRRINPGQKIDYTNQQTGTVWEIPWAYQVTETSWVDQETDLNEELQAKYRAQKLKDVMYQKHQVVWSDICETQERECWAVPDHGLMEALVTTGGVPRQPQSLFVFNNEFTNGVFPSYAANGSTIQQISTIAQPKWACQRQGYDYDAAAGETTGIFSAMFKLYHQVKFDPLPKMPEYSEKTTSPHVIFTQLEGLANYEHALRVNQDWFRGVGKTSGQDPAYAGPTYMGLPIERLDTLETIAAYPTGVADALSTYDDTANVGPDHWGGPRYHFYNFEYVRWVAHARHHFQPSEPIKLPYNVETWAQQYTLWNNVYSKSNRRHGTLYPNVDDIANVA